MNKILLQVQKNIQNRSQKSPEIYLKRNLHNFRFLRRTRNSVFGKTSPAIQTKNLSTWVYTRPQVPCVWLSPSKIEGRL